MGRKLVRGAVCALLAVSLYWSVRLAWADHLSRSIRLADRERAVVLAPALASLYDRLADRRSDLGQMPLAELRRAAALEPEDPARLERLAQNAELAGDFPAAERSLLGAAARSRLFQPRYLLAQYYFRHPSESAFWSWSRASMEAAYGDVLPLLDLCWRIRPDAVWLTREVIPERRSVQQQWLVFLVRENEMSAAAAQARHMAAQAEASDLQSLTKYMDAALAMSETAGALDVWNALSRRRLLSDGPVDGPALTNAGFAHPPSGSGFDWRPADVPGVGISFLKNQLRVSFSGTQPESCTLLWQYVPITPGERYRVISRGASDGLAWVVEIASPRGDLARAILIYRRPLGSPRFEGTAVLTGLKLERVP